MIAVTYSGGWQRGGYFSLIRKIMSRDEHTHGRSQIYGSEYDSGDVALEGWIVSGVNVFLWWVVWAIVSMGSHIIDSGIESQLNIVRMTRSNAHVKICHVVEIRPPTIFECSNAQVNICQDKRDRSGW